MFAQFGRFRFTRFLCAVSTLIVCGAVTPVVSAQEKADPKAPVDFAQRLKKLETRIEEARVENKIPGLSLAVVMDDRIVFAKGFGSRDLQNNEPVTANTRYAIGSTTKAFTGALIAMLVDERKMEWDDPVTKHIPDFKLDVDTGEDEITIRDLLSHRTGLTRLSLTWAGGTQSRSEIIKHAARAKAYAKFREKFQYNNVMYMAAGVSAGRAAGSDWDTLIAKRLFEPLGMENSSTTMAAAKADSEMSLGYMWDKDDEEYIQLPMRNLDSIAPAGAINSSVTDMAQWLRFQLGNGTFEGTQLLSKEQHAETWKKQIEIGGGVNYGFGWMLREWDGKKVVEHGGNIDGFAAQVTLLPEMNAGYVLLTNVTVTPLQSGSVSLVFDTLFGVEKESRGLAGISTEELTGKYIANFGPFNDKIFEVLMKNGKLAVDVPGQTTFELKPPGDDGKWYFALTDTIAVSFNKNEDGRITSMKFYQGGMEPEFIREDYEPKPESPLNVTAPIVGKYRDEEGDVDVDVSVKKGRVVVTATGKGTFTLLPPKDDDLWKLRPRPEALQFRFNRNDDGTVKSMSRIQGDKEIEMPRIDKSAASAIPAVEDLVALIKKGAGNWESKPAGIRMTGVANFVHQGVTGKTEMTFTPDGKHLSRHDFGELATIAEAYDGERGFVDASVSPFVEAKGDALTLMKMRHPAWLVSDWQESYSEITITGETDLNGRKTFVVSLSGEGLSERTLYVDAENGRVVKEKMLQPVGDLGQIPVTTKYSDYRSVSGVMLPFRVSSDTAVAGTTDVTFEKVEQLSTISDSVFTLNRSK